MVLDDTLPERMTARLSEHGLAIFLFHGVIRRQRHRVRNYTGKHIVADLFARSMKQLTQVGHALSMGEVLSCCEAGAPFPPRSYAITFDDGFENNLSVAAPILADFRIPATIYITTGFVESNGMSWIDRIESVVEDVTSQLVHVAWAQEPFYLQDVQSRINFLQAVRQYVKNTPCCDPEAFADGLCAQLGRPGRLSTDDPLDLKMSWGQVRAAHEGRDITIGGHSHTHPILSFLSPARLADELDKSLALLVTRAGVGPSHYSYPEGLAHCYSDTVIAELKRRGVRCCPTAIDGTNTNGADPFHLRRIMI
jgi:peptidoglycan/xylan/chitin deacetylase (PgdA/CDA1 family)